VFPSIDAVIGVMAGGLVMGALGDDPSPAWTFGGKPVPDLFQGNPCVDWSHSDPAVSLVPLLCLRFAAASEEWPRHRRSG
jgi:hypothetical protein